MHTDLYAVASELGISLPAIMARGLLECEEATELELLEIADNGKEHFLVPTAAAAWRLMNTAAEAENVQLQIVSAFRSIERQAEIVRRKIAAGQGIEEILTVCAAPGFSEHHTGRAVDLSTPGAPMLEPEFDRTLAFAWLMRRAHEFGFYLSFPAGNSQGYLYEPWHWCFRDAKQTDSPDLRQPQLAKDE